MSSMTSKSMPLKPADMVSVVNRTNLRIDFNGFMLPIYEAISNGIHSLQGYTQPDGSESRVDITVFTTPLSVRVRDNGSGLNNPNFQEFITPFTGHKLRRGGKGFGRFIAFKVFENISYDSRYIDEDNVTQSRSFDFELVHQEEIVFRPSFDGDLGTHGCTVKFENLKPAFQWVEEKFKPNDFVDGIVKYFLTYFATGRMPKTTVVIDGVTYDPLDRFAAAVKNDSTTNVLIEINGEPTPFEVGISKSRKGELFDHHSLLLFADDRIIGSGRNIERKIGDPYFLDENGNRNVSIISVKGNYLDTRANSARTDIESPESEIDEIVSFVTGMLLDQERDFVTSKRSDQRKNVVTVLRRNPLLRASLHHIGLDDYISSRPMSWTAEEFVSDLSLRRFRQQSSWEKELATAVRDPLKLAEKRDSLLAHIEQENRDSLAAYVVHRTTVLDIADRTIGLQSSGSMAFEDVFHDLVHPRHEDSISTKFYEHNLWLIDDRLSFVSYLSSDRTIHGGRRQAGDKVADIIFFDDCSVYRNKDESSLVLVEFKRPGRNDYSFGPEKSDPVTQVINTAAKIRDAKSLITSNGSRVSVPEGTKIFAYIIADMEPTLINVYESHDFDETWDRNGYYKYHEKKDVFIEAMSFDKLISDAKKRNTAFFDVLMGDII